MVYLVAGSGVGVALGKGQRLWHVSVRPSLYVGWPGGERVAAFLGDRKSCVGRAAGLILEQGTQPPQAGSQEMHSSILLLLPDPNCSDSAYSHKTKRACGAEHGCYRSQGGERPEGARQGLLPITTQGLSFRAVHTSPSAYLTVDGG